ncbi:hypothetical protein [Pedobacter frigoris]|nr:hypothetical protein [Pedobacter frigoris]
MKLIVLLTATANGVKVSTGRAQSASVDYVSTQGTGKAFESKG